MNEETKNKDRMTLERIKGFLFVLDKNLCKRETNLRDILRCPDGSIHQKFESCIEGISHDRGMVEKWISELKGMLNAHPVPKSSGICENTIPSQGNSATPVQTVKWSSWNTVRNSLSKHSVSAVNNELERQNLINRALYAFYMHLGKGIEIGDVADYMKEIYKSNLYSSLLFQNAIDKADKSLFGGKLRPEIRKRIDINKDINKEIVDILNSIEEDMRVESETDGGNQQNQTCQDDDSDLFDEDLDMP